MRDATPQPRCKWPLSTSLHVLLALCGSRALDVDDNVATSSVFQKMIIKPTNNACKIQSRFEQPFGRRKWLRRPRRRRYEREEE